MQREFNFFYIIILIHFLIFYSCSIPDSSSNKDNGKSSKGTSTQQISGNKNNFQISINPQGNYSSKLINYSIQPGTFNVTSLNIIVTQVSTGAEVGNFTWNTGDGAISYDVNISQFGEYQLKIIHYGTNGIQNVQVEESTIVDIQVSVYTIVNVVPGGALQVVVNGTTGNDSTAPQLVYSFPSNSSIEVPRNISSIILRFDDEMNNSKKSINFEGFGSSITNNIRWIDNKNLEINVYEFLNQNFQYRLTLNKSGSDPANYFRNTSGLILPQNITITFTTDNIDLYYKDVRNLDVSSYNLNEYIIKSLRDFNQSTIFNPNNQLIANQVMEKCKNPGLGVRSLRQQGIIGNNINVAIIDQKLASLNHPEYAGKIVKYHEIGSDLPNFSEWSMHGPAVLSLLVGSNTGTAPGARVYFVAVPQALTDATYESAALDWIVQENSFLPEGQKIRVVSVSAAPNQRAQNGYLWDIAVQNATNAGILVLDCTEAYGFIEMCFYDINDPDNLSKCRPNEPRDQLELYNNRILAPASLRTQAEDRNTGEYSYQFTGIGGTSWTRPYVAGLFAMGLQIKPNLTNTQLKQLLFSTAYILPDGNKVVNPINFINTIRSM